MATFVEQAHVNDIGTTFRVTVYDISSTGGTSAANISDATSLVFYFQKSNCSVISRTAQFTNDGTDGLIQYTTVDGDLDIAGNWSLQAKVVTLGGSWKTDVGYFIVHENLE